MHRGYVKLWRRLHDNKLWLSEKFTRAQAWVDLIMIANHKDGWIRKRGIKIHLERGDVGYSEVELSKRWKWSRGKVRRFLNELCSENDPELERKTVQQNKFITSCYHIRNYNLYQGASTANGQQTEQQTDSKRYRNKNDKNDKNNTSPANAGLVKKTDQLVEHLYRAKRFEKINAFVNKMRKAGVNESALNYTLSEFSKRNIPAKSGWAYCTKVLQIENGNFNEQEFRNRVEQQRRELEQWQKKQ